MVPGLSSRSRPRCRYVPVQSVQQMFAPPAVQGSAAPEMQTVPGPTAASQSSSVVQIGPPHSPSRQVARDGQSLSVVSDADHGCVSATGSLDVTSTPAPYRFARRWPPADPNN